MHRSAMEDCLPWLIALLAAFGLLWLLVRVSGAHFSLARLRAVHSNEQGAVQSLSFVLTVPIFVMVMMLIVQISQLMIGIMVVHYAAFAAARAAVVWIPADTGGEEGENRISSYLPGNGGNIPGTGQQYTILPGSPKYEKIKMAAILACMPLAPSRDLGLNPAGDERDALHKMYRGLDPGYDTNDRVPARIDNKFAYAQEATQIELHFMHKDDGVEPPLAQWLVPHDPFEFYPNEVGWQDPIQVTVTHQFALLPGPGRLLARRETSYDGSPDKVAASIFARRGVYVRDLTATATLGNEGLKSVAPYRHSLQNPGSNSTTSVERTRVLFVGNSYTYTNDLPGVVQSMAKAAGLDVEVAERTAGGATLAQHAADAQTLQTIASGEWDYVVLQEQSQTPLFNRPGMFAAARQLHAQIQQSGAQTVLYMTWARENAPHTQAGLASAYRELASQLGADVAPAGEVWQSLRAQHPQLRLYKADGSHPSPAGTHVAASVIFAEIFGISPVGLPAEGSQLSSSEAREAQRLAWEATRSRNSPSDTDPPTADQPSFSSNRSSNSEPAGASPTAPELDMSLVPPLAAASLLAV